MLEGWALLACLIIVAAIAIMVGATIGFYSASTDLQKERAAAWDRGMTDTARAVARRAPDARAIISELRNPYRKALAPVPPHYVMPTPPRATLYDQDAPTDAALAIELKGDD